MIKLLRALFEPRPPLPPYAHFHIDDDGHRVFCDESACRPAQDPPLLAGLLVPPVR